MTDQFVTNSSVSEPGGEDFSANTSTAGRVAVGGAATGEIGASRDRDWFAVELVAGRTYTIDLKGGDTDDGELIDPYLRGIYNADGKRISDTKDDDGGVLRNSQLTFVATESGTYYIAAGAYSGRGTYTLEVTDNSPPDVNQAPAFDPQAYLFELAENTDGSTNRVSLGTMSATDPEGETVSYSLPGGNTLGFEIDAASGEVFYTGTGWNREEGYILWMLVEASDGELTTNTNFQVNFIDVPEPPTFGQQDYAFELAENADGSTTGVSLGTVSAVDPEGETVSYSLVGGNASGLFEIDADSGELFYIGTGEDFEAGTSPFELTVRASDGDLSVDTAVTVTVTDVLETATQLVQQPPAFGVQGYAFTLPENTDGSTDRVSLGTVSAIDPKGAALSYSLEGGNGSGLFEIDAASGELFYTGAGEDFETGTGSFELTVRASDGDLFTDTFVVVGVADVQEVPAFARQGYAFELAENADGSTSRVSLGTVLAVDPDGTALSYSIEGGNTSGLFEIDAASGELFYTGTGEDFEAGTGPFELTVRASDGTHAVDTTVTVSVTDVQEDPAEEPVQQSVSEPAGEDFSANTSTAGEVAVGGSVTGTIGSSGDQDWIAVELVAGVEYRIDLEGSETGAGTLADPLLRWLHDPDGAGIRGSRNDDGGEGENARQVFTPTESGTYYISANGKGSGTGTYRLSVTQVSPPAQEALAFAEQSYAFELAENTDGSTNRVSLGTVAASDPEGAALSYSLEDGNGSGLFEIDAASGELFYTGAGEDFEAGTGPFELTVRASDGDLFTDTSVVVGVADVQEAPAFGAQGYAFALAENTDGSTDRVSLGTVVAVDPEGAALSYSLEGGNGAGLFEIDAASGELFYTGAGEDFEAGMSPFELTVRASDGELLADTTVTVSVATPAGQIIEGDGGANTLLGGVGDDTIYGRGGDDELHGNAGDDRLEGGGGDDRLEGGEGDDVLDGGARYDDLYGGAGDDTLYGGQSEDYLDGQDGNDRLHGGAHNDQLRGNAGDDALYGEDGTDGLRGDAGNDRLDGGAGDDRLDGGEGDDTLDGGAGDDTLHGDEGHDTLHGGAGLDEFVFRPEDGNDVITDFTRGEDRIKLQAFPDDAVFDDLTITSDANGVTIDLAALGGGTILLQGMDINDLDSDDVVIVPDDLVISGDGDDNILEGGAGDDMIWGGLGDDTLHGGAGDDDLNGGEGDDELNGGEGDDDLRGHEGDDTLYGGGGDDKLDGDEGADVLYGGTGDDLLFGDEGNDTLDGEEGDDRLRGDEGNDTLHGGEGDDNLEGDEGADVLHGGAGDDRLRGDEGADVLYGGAGDDTLDGDSYLSGAAGDDTLYGEEGDDVLSGLWGDDRLYGGAGVDELDGDEGNDYLHGGDGDDDLTGWEGHDRLEGGEGNDRLRGYDGDDTFIFGPGHGSDRIDDFTVGEDLIDLTQFSNISGLDDLTITAVPYNRGFKDVEIDLTEHGGGTIRLKDFLDRDSIVGPPSYELEDLDASSFLFAETPPVDVQQPPAFADQGYTFELAENTDGSTNRVSLGTVAAVDPDGTALSYSLAGGNGAGLFEIDAASGELFYVGAGEDYEAGTGPFELTVRASDGDLFTDTTVTVDVTDVQEAPVETNSGDDTILSGVGDESMTGGGGDDVFVFHPNNGNDTITDFHDGPDRIDLSAFSTISGMSDLTVTQDGDDAVIDLTAHGGGTIRLQGKSVDHVYERNFLFKAIEGDEVGNALRGDGSNNTIHGRGGDDGIQGLGGDDTLYGDEGDDWLRGDGGDDTLYGGEGDDALYGSGGNDELFGGSGNDSIWGMGGNDTLHGGAGSDEFVFQASGRFLLPGLSQPNPGNDVISDFTDGEDHIRLAYFPDSLSFDDLTITSDANGVTIDLTENFGGTIFLQGFDIGNLDADDFVYLTNEEIFGDDGDNTLESGAGGDALYGYAGDDTLYGYGGDDALYGGADVDLLYGGEGNDTLEGGDDADTLVGGEGDDTLEGDDGDDTLEGGVGNDQLRGGGGDDRIDGGEGNDSGSGGDGADTVVGGAGDDRLFGDGGDDRLYGDGGDDRLYGDDGDDVLFGGEGDDWLEGDHWSRTEFEFGDDRLYGGDGDDTMRGRGGADRLEGGDGNDVLFGDDENDRLAGGAGHDQLYGGAGNDRLEGDAGSDDLYGGDGDDRLDGGAGYDDLVGGAGNDTFVFGPGHVDDGTHGRGDEIHDFTVGEDLIDLTQFSSISGFEDLTFTEVLNWRSGVNFQIDLTDHGGGAILLEDVAADDLDASDFLFYEPSNTGGQSNHQPPEFGADNYAFELAENADGSSSGVSLGTVSATDPEGAALVYSIKGGNASGLFEIDAASGELFYVGTGEDFEAGIGSFELTGRFELTVRASDGDLFTDTTVTVDVTNVYESTDGDNVPEPSGEDISEDTSTAGRIAVGGAVTGNIGHDGDRDWFAVELVEGREYTIDLKGSYRSDGTLSNPYLRGIHDSDGNLIPGTTNDDGIFTWRNSQVTFTASESGTHYIAAGAGAFERGTYTVEVTDNGLPVDDPPTVGNPAYAVEENSDGSTNRVAVGTFWAVDPEGAALIFSIEGGNEAGLFEIDAASGELFYVGAGEDFEAGTGPFELTVRASDGNLFTDATVTIYVDNEQEPPAFGEQGYTFELAENADGSTSRVSLGTVAAVDPDGDTLAYSIEAGNGAGLFEIDAASGELFYTGAGEDFEAGTAPFELTVRASDGALSTDTTVAISVTDEPVAPPVLQSVSEPSGQDFSANMSTDGRVVVGDSVTGNIGSARERDWFAVELVAGGEYRFDLKGSPTGDGTLFDPHLRGIYDKDGRFIRGTKDDDGGTGFNSRKTFTAEESGTHYVAARGHGSEQGTYTLSVEEVVDGI